MAVKIFIKRYVKKGKTQEAVELLKDVRSQALKQPGYISGETLICIDPPGRNEYLVRSTWHSVEDWNNWLHSEERTILDDQIEQLSREKAEYAIYESLVSGIIPASNNQGKTNGSHLNY